MTVVTPAGWDKDTHRLWQEGRRDAAIQRAIAAVNAAQGPAGAPALFQLAAYLFFLSDYRGAAQLLDRAVSLVPDNLEALLNLAMCRSRAGETEAAVAAAQRYLDQGGGDVMAWDILGPALHRLGRDEEGRAAGERALIEKARDAEARGEPVPLQPVPDGWQDKPRVIAFSLWGKHPRYLRGALHNLVAARTVYPGWRCRFYLDSSVPTDLAEALAREGGEVVIEAGAPSLRRRLTRRFDVANDSAIGAFLVRDCDSLVGPREAAAVDEWLASGMPFHLIRDWWSHTDPILAGMWGGIAGVLPPLAPLVETYRSGKLETPNIDQWFLRDRLWSAIRPQAMVHDRLFRVDGARPVPGPIPNGNLHIGQNEYAVRRAPQAAALAPWAASVPSLGLASGAPTPQGQAE